MINELTYEEIDRIESDEEKKYVVKIPEWRLDETLQEIAMKNSQNESGTVWFLDTENRLAKIEFEQLTIQDLLLILSNPNESKILKEELIKKIERQPTSELSRKYYNAIRHGLIRLIDKE